MSRERSFGESTFGRRPYDNDPGDFLPDLVFVSMSFRGGDRQEVYAAIKEECVKLGLHATRTDETVGSGFIIKEIMKRIEQAEYLVFDLTEERPNVYYELGYAHGVGNEPEDILLLAKEGTQVHFDIGALRIQFYRTIDHLRSIMAANLEGMIRQTRRR
jgi:hypothetical protein